MGNKQNRERYAKYRIKNTTRMRPLVPTAIPEVRREPVQRPEWGISQCRNGCDPQSRRRISWCGRPFSCRSKPFLRRFLYRNEEAEGTATRITKKIPESGRGARLPIRPLLLAGRVHGVGQRISRYALCYSLDEFMELVNEYLINR